MKLKPTNRAHILDIFNTYYGNRVKSDSIVFHRGSFYTIPQIIRCDPPQWTINAPAQTNHRTEPIFCMDTPLGTTAGYSGAIFEI